MNFHTEGLEVADVRTQGRPGLGDKEIRECLKERLSRLFPAPRAIIEELRVHKGNAIADVVTLHRYAHCYEIKSDKDKIEKAQKQAQFFDLVFQKSTLVTTDRHLDRAIRLLPPHWGILLARETGERVSFTYHRPACKSPHFDKKLALMTLWRSELASLAEPLAEVNINKHSRSSLSALLAEKLSASQLSREICSRLATRLTTP